MRRWILATSLAALAACDPEPFTVIVSIKDTELVAYRDGDGAWTPVSPGRSGKARLKITRGYYSLAWICGGFRPRSYVVHSTIGDEPQAHCTSGSGVPEAVLLSGVSSPNAVIFVGTNATNAFELGDYAIQSNPGFHDVVALSVTRDRILIQRDLDLRQDRTLDLPVDDRGLPTAMVQAQVFGPPQTVTLSSELSTRNGDRLVLNATGDTVIVFPDRILLDTDRAVVRVQGEKCEGQVRMSAAPRIELPEAPMPVVTRERVFGVSDDWSYQRLEVTGDRGSYAINATSAWIDEAGADGLEIPDLSLLPEFSWDLLSVGIGETVSWRLDIERGDRASAFTSCKLDGIAAW